MEPDSAAETIWQAVCLDRDIPEPGDYFLCDFLPQPVIVIRADDAGVRAFLNVCRHREMRLLSGDNGTAKGHCWGRLIRCPYHAWAYDLRGRLKHVPFGNDFADFDKTLWNLHGLSVKVQRGQVFVGQNHQQNRTTEEDNHKR
jgi:phenylpropionate dioxygenase-like ring-hydroxylating dioxygenase large terminal subunit